MKFTDFLNEGIYGSKNAVGANSKNLKAFKLAIKKKELIDLIKDETAENYITRGGLKSAHGFNVRTDELYLVLVDNVDGKASARVDSIVEFFLDDPEEAEGLGQDPRDEDQGFYVPIMYNIDLNKLKLIRAELDSDYEGDYSYKDAVKYISSGSIEIEY